MTERLDVIRSTKLEIADAQARFDAAVVDAMSNRIVGQTTAADVAEAAGWTISRLYQFMASKRAVAS